MNLPNGEPRPDRRRALRMVWRDLAFLHWPVDPSVLRPFIPPELEVDTFDGSAWIGVVPFEMRATRFAFTPPIPTATNFPELNVRTYVRDGDRAGVWFFSLDAASRLAVVGARATFALPYFRAAMAIERADDEVRYASDRLAGYGAPHASFRARYRASGPPQAGSPGSIEHFLTERYSLFSAQGFGVDRTLRRGVLRGDIWHRPWPLQPAEVEIESCDMLRLVGIDAPTDSPLAHFAKELDVDAFAPRPVARPLARE